MRFFALFIHRPVATTLLAAAIVLAGVLGFQLLPVAPLPQVDVPVIVVSASLPGASPETMASSVAMPLERALGHIAGVSEMTSSSSLGSTQVILVFDFGRDINGAARDVQAAINASQSLLPTGMPGRPRYRKVNPSGAPIMILTLTSDVYSPGQLYDYASTQLAQKISQIDGVGDVAVGGSSLPAVRVALNPQALFHNGISLNDVGRAISDANQRRPLGTIHSVDKRWMIKTNDALMKAQDYLPLIIHYKKGAAVRLEDIASVTDSVENTHNAGMKNDQPAVILLIRKTPEANIIQTVDRVRETLPVLRDSIPASISLEVAQDRSPVIRASLYEVERSLIIAIALVILVVFSFLRNGRATLIPAVAVPVSLIGTFAAMYLYGFSLNNLSLMALTIATGFVVDDVIVVLENISRYIETGLPPLQAALLGIREVGFTVLSMGISLISLFLPLLLPGGMIGQLFKEFLVTLSAAIVISMIISITLTPMMCGWLLRTAHPVARIHSAGRLTNWLQQKYAVSLNWVLRHSRWILVLFVATIVFTGWLFITIPKTFMPEQDTGRVMGYIQADQSISFQLMRQKLTDFMRIVRADPAVESVVGFTGGSGGNNGTMFISLKPLSVRHASVQSVISRLRGKLTKEPGAALYLMAVSDLQGGGRESGASYQYTLLSDNLDDLRSFEPKLRQALTKVPELADVNSDQQDNGSELQLTYNRAAMAQLGISAQDANILLNSAFGQRQISTIYQPLNQYHVVMEVDPLYAQNESALNQMYIINQDGKAIPLSWFAHWQSANAPLEVNHQGLSAASTISFNLPQGGTLSQASDAIARTMVSLGVPSSIRGTFAGDAEIFEQSQHDELLMFFAAIACVYIVLGVLYESYVHPLTILSTLPSASVGALLALMLFNTPFSLIATIGILLLIGIVKKNAIMMVNFALQIQRDSDVSSRDAIFQASLLRFRPIVMTTLAALLSALPLILGTGTGSELRQPLGTAIAGLVVSQLLTLYTTPVIYLYMDKLSRRKKRAAFLQELSLTAPEFTHGGTISKDNG